MNKFENGVKRIKLKSKDVILSSDDIFSLLLSSLGASVSNMPKNYQSSALSDKLELFDPEKVVSPELLPLHWKKVWKKHNEPDRIACIRFRYRYVHVPFDILPQYPRVPCKGIFALTSRKVLWNKIEPSDLIHLGGEFDE